MKIGKLHIDIYTLRQTSYDKDREESKDGKTVTIKEKTIYERHTIL